MPLFSLPYCTMTSIQCWIQMVQFNTLTLFLVFGGKHLIVRRWMVPKYVTLVYWLFWAVSTWKQQRQGEAGYLWTALSAWRQVPLKELSCHRHLPPPQGSVINQGDWLGSQGRRLDCDTKADKLSLTLPPPTCLLRVHPSSLKTIYFPLGGPHLSLLRWYLSLNSEPPWKGAHFSHDNVRYSC